MKRMVLVFIAHVRANVWCLFHFGHCILTHKTKAPGCWPQTDRVETGTGSILNGTWKTARVFYANMGISVLLGIFFFVGCATGPQTALDSRALRASKVIYFEQSDRIPKDVLLAAYDKKEPMAATLSVIPPEILAKAIEKVLEVIPEMSRGYGQERMFNALLGRRMLFIGYETPEQLEKINAIVQGMSGAIGHVTPQKKPEGTP